jgi:hypothetical protein
MERCWRRIILRCLVSNCLERAGKVFGVFGSKNISTRGPLNCRSLGFARDDKGEGGAHLSSRYGGSTEPLVIGDFHLLGWAEGP